MDTNIAMGDHRDLLDIIDNLRSQGVSRYVDLPEIIVCGDQSAGKSSVLEAISRMPFPTKDGLCTRFATELVLRRGPVASTKVSIIPGEGRFGEHKERLENWQPEASIDTGGLGAVTEEARIIMADPTAAANTGGDFFDDTLRIELTGPEQPHLTMVDLPGLFRSGNKKQSDADVEIVRGMVKKYMARPRSIILTVVSATYEYVLQEVTTMAKHADPEGLRTMGLITKPDTLEVGSNTEADYVRLAQNMEQELRLGWHVLRNRKFKESHFTSAERDDIESDFFSKGLWGAIDSAHCGVAALKTRLSAVLRDQILAQLPSLMKDVEEGIRDCEVRLGRLGPERETRQQQLSYLLDISEKYTSLTTQAVEGTYTSRRFFGNRKEKDKFSKRLMAVVRHHHENFADEMRLNGQSQYIVDSEGEDDDGRAIRDLPRISRSEYLEEVASNLKFSKGRELPGLFNPLIVNDLFVEQCEPWEGITRTLVDNVMDATKETIREIVKYITASDVADRIREIVFQGIERLKVELDTQVNELLESLVQPALTYNPELINEVQRTQQRRHKRVIEKRIHKTFGIHTFDDPTRKISVNPIELLDVAGEGFEPNMERFGCVLAVDYMQAYYKIALNVFIDNVNELALEKRLIRELPTLFRPSDFPDMSDEDLCNLAGETPESSLERTRLRAKAEILKTGLKSLKSLRKRRNVVKAPAQQDQGLQEDSKKSPAMTPSWSGSVVSC